VSDRAEPGARGLDFKASRKSDPEGSDAGVPSRTGVTTPGRFWAVAGDGHDQATVQVHILFHLETVESR
jgi:hypothetical protein